MRAQDISPAVMTEAVVSATENTATTRKISIWGAKLVASAFTVACVYSPLPDVVDNIPGIEVLVDEEFEVSGSDSSAETVLSPAIDDSGEWIGRIGTQDAFMSEGVDNRVIFVDSDVTDDVASSVVENIVFVESSINDVGQGEILVDIGLFEDVTSSINEDMASTELLLTGANSEIDINNTDGPGNVSAIANSIEESGVDDILTFYPEDMSIPVTLTSEQYQKLYDYMIAEGYTDVGLRQANEQGLDILSIIKGDNESVVLMKTLDSNTEGKGAAPQVKMCELPVEAKIVETIPVKPGEKKLNPWFTLLASGLLAYKFGVRDRVKRRVVDGRIAPEAHILEDLKAGRDVSLEDRLKVFEYRRSLVKAVNEGRERIEGKVRVPLKLVVGSASVIMFIPTLVALSSLKGESVSRDDVTIEEPSMPTLNVSACDPLSKIVFVDPNASDSQTEDKSLTKEKQYILED
ncbi:MAG: hypothetical protein Q7T41_02375 [Candidatus Saccharibacteria bacterium]|nr:hypothetical protein [Candidatus Saccharibacteria bacterium]